MPGGSWRSGESAQQCRPEKGRQKTRAQGSGGVAGRDRIAPRETGPGKLGQRRVDQGEAGEPERRGTSQASAG